MHNFRPGRLLLASLILFLASAQAQQPLNPEDDWLGAMRAGGIVNLGPGAFYTTDYLELTSSVTVRGQGMGVTSLWFASDGGDYGEQLTLLGSETGQTRFEFTGMDISYDLDLPTDLVVLWGNTHLILNGVSVNYAIDDDAYVMGESDLWRGSGLMLGDGASAHVNASTFYLNMTNGITAIGAERLVVTDSSFHDNWWAGIYVVETPLTASRNHFESNDVGIEIYGTASRVLAANTFSGQYSMDTYEE